MFAFSSFFFKDPAPPEIYTLSLHDALPICARRARAGSRPSSPRSARISTDGSTTITPARETVRRSEEHTSELQSRQYLVCRLLLEKKKHNKQQPQEHRPPSADEP